MPRFLMILILIITIGTITFSGCKADISEEVEEDGGVLSYSEGNDAPQSIESEEIISFECEFSQIASAEDNELSGKVYTLCAVLEDESVACTFKWYDRYGEGETYEFIEDASFMAKLQDIVSKYDFAKYNGNVYKVSGLPEQYGATLDITYASGESIYSANNEECFLETQAMSELAELFERE